MTRAWHIAQAVCAALLTLFALHLLDRIAAGVTAVHLGLGS